MTEQVSQAEQDAAAAAPAAAQWPQFYDSCAKTYPAGASMICVYGDSGGGPPECNGLPPDPEKYLIHSITWAGGEDAWKAQICDYEPYLESYTIPGRLKNWASRRVDGKRRAIVYSDRVDLANIKHLLGALWDSPLLVHWIATGDGRLWTPQQLAVDILGNEHFMIAPSKIWGNQHSWGSQWDTSSLFGTW